MTNPSSPILAPLLFLNHDLTRLISDHLRNAPIILDQASHADSLVGVFGFRFAKLRSVAAPNQYCENLMWVRLVKTQKRRTALGSVCIVSACDFAAYGTPL